VMRSGSDFRRNYPSNSAPLREPGTTQTIIGL